MSEPLLLPDRLHLLPIKHADVWDFYKLAESAFWTVEEVDLANDRKDFESLKKSEQHFLIHVLAFFASADGLVFDNINANFGEEVQMREAKAFYAFQLMMEGVHNEMYSVMVEGLIQDEAERLKVYKAIETFPALKNKADWARKYMDRNNAPFGVRLVAFVIMEYIFFSASFAAIFFFKKQNKMHGLCFSNELISKDEGLHARFGCLLVTKYLKDVPSTEIIHAMVREAVDIEIDFVTESLPVALLGMNAHSMSQYVRFVADHMLGALNQPHLFNASNPFPWMELISMEGKTNFFEKRVGEYSKAGVGDAAQSFSLNEDF